MQSLLRSPPLPTLYAAGSQIAHTITRANKNSLSYAVGVLNELRLCRWRAGVCVSVMRIDQNVAVAWVVSA